MKNNKLPKKSKLEIPLEENTKKQQFGAHFIEYNRKTCFVEFPKYIPKT